MELFKNDFPHLLKTFKVMTLTSKTGKNITIIPQLYMDFQANSKFLGVYIPTPAYTPNVEDETFEICFYILYNYKHLLDISKGSEVKMKLVGEESTKDKDLTFSGRVFIYHDSELTVDKIAELRKLYRKNNLDVQFRGSDYLIFNMFIRKEAQQSPPPTTRDPKSPPPSQE
jgi:hypothetical protein